MIAIKFPKHVFYDFGNDFIYYYYYYYLQWDGMECLLDLE
jgi:hypothetical protein